MSYRISPPLEAVVERIIDEIKRQMESRSYRAANELREAALEVLRGQGSGKRYRVPGTYRRQRDEADGRMKNGRYYTASAPGQPPAARNGIFWKSWQSEASASSNTYISRIVSNLHVGRYVLGQLLEEGTSKMAPRPHHERILEKAKEPILRIYNEPYF